MGQKLLHHYLMSLLIIVTLHTPICGMHEVPYVHNIIFCLLISLDPYSLCFNSDLNILMGIKLSSLPVPILYSQKSVI